MEPAEEVLTREGSSTNSGSHRTQRGDSVYIFWFNLLLTKNSINKKITWSSSPREDFLRRLCSNSALTAFGAVNLLSGFGLVLGFSWFGFSSFSDSCESVRSLLFLRFLRFFLDLVCGCCPLFSKH